MSTAAYRPLVMEERKSLGTAERIRLTDEILLDALFTGLGANRKSSHVEQGNIAIHRHRRGEHHLLGQVTELGRGR